MFRILSFRNCTRKTELNHRTAPEMGSNQYVWCVPGKRLNSESPLLPKKNTELLVYLSIPQVGGFFSEALRGLKPDCVPSRTEKGAFQNFVWYPILCARGRAAPRRCFQIDESSARGRLKFPLDYVSRHQSQPHFSCLKSSLKNPQPASVFWLTAVGPTNFSLGVNIFIVYSMKTKRFTGSQKYKEKQIWGFMTMIELFFFLYDSCWKDMTMLFHDRLGYLDFDFRYLKSTASGHNPKCPV